MITGRVWQLPDGDCLFVDEPEQTALIEVKFRKEMNFLTAKDKNDIFHAALVKLGQIYRSKTAGGIIIPERNAHPELSVYTGNSKPETEGES